MSLAHTDTALVLGMKGVDPMLSFLPFQIDDWGLGCPQEVPKGPSSITIP